MKSLRLHTLTRAQRLTRLKETREELEWVRLRAIEHVAERKRNDCEKGLTNLLEAQDRLLEAASVDLNQYEWLSHLSQIADLEHVEAKTAWRSSSERSACATQQLAKMKRRTEVITDRLDRTRADYQQKQESHLQESRLELWLTSRRSRRD